MTTTVSPEEFRFVAFDAGQIRSVGDGLLSVDRVVFGHVRHGGAKIDREAPEEALDRDFAVEGALIPVGAGESDRGDGGDGGEAEGLLEPAELLVAGRVGHPAGLDQRQVRLGNARTAGQLVERKAQPASLAAKFGPERFHGTSRPASHSTTAFYRAQTSLHISVVT